MKRLGLYLHLPFCKSKCLYCDFCSFPHPKTETMEAYVFDGLEREILRWSERVSALDEPYVVDTVYFGGGTPTLLPADLLCWLLGQLDSQFKLATDVEITVECNPATGSAEAFSALRRAGFNRISLGLQSVHDHELKRLGRRHDFDGFCRTYDEIRRAGFQNVSIDLMSGIPEQTEESYQQTLERVTDLAPEHISTYGLIVEEGTPFATLQSRGQLVLPDEETAEKMYFEGIDFLAKRGYRQYEISNFAKKGYESRHNLKYWNCEEYLGFGLAAYSDFLGARFGNSRDLGAYIEGREILCEREEPNVTERKNEYVMLRMRLSDGVYARAYEERFGGDFEAEFGAGLSRYLDGGFVRKTDDGYAFTPQGMYVSNTILSEILDF